MARPRFSEMLVSRRRQLGLSISQASQVLRLKEQVLIAFEDGDFDHIPKSGYAQGMLSSYARYLGLNPRQVVSQFSADLGEYVKSGAGEASAEYGATMYGTGDTYLAPKKLLPTSGGPAGDLGAFATTSQPHSRQQSAPLVNQRRYVGTLHDEPERAYGYDVEDDYYVQPTEQRQYTTRQPAGAQRARTSSSRTRTRRSSARAQSTYAHDDVTTRRVIPSQYTDDLSYGAEAVPYEAASTRTGRRSSRNIASTSRPNVQRRQTGAQGRDVPRRRGGVVGAVAEFFSDSRRALAVVLGLLALALTVVIILSVRSCVGAQSAEPNKTVPVTQTDQTDKDSTTDEVAKAIDEAADQAADAKDAASAKGTKKVDDTPKETKVEVRVEAGSVSWVEVLCDGESKVATTVTGPWSETYDVHDSITIEVGDTSAVTVLENGTQRQFDAKASGIGSITIQGTPETTAANTTGGKPADTTPRDEGQDAQDADDTTSQQPTTTQDTGDDEYMYEYNGYDIWYNAAGDFYYFFDPETGQRLNAADGSPI